MSSSAVIVPHINILLAAAAAVTDLEMMEPVEKLDIKKANDNDDNNNDQTGDEEDVVEDEVEEDLPVMEGVDDVEEEEKKEDDATGEDDGNHNDGDDGNGDFAIDDNPTEEGAIEEEEDEEEEQEQGGQPKLGDILREEVLDGEEFQNVVDSNQYDTVTIAIDTEWIKCACGSLKFGVRFGQCHKGGDSSSDGDCCCFIWDFFGGTDTDRSHVGDTFFWQAVQAAAPTVTSQQWMEFVDSHDVLVVEEKDDDDEDEEDEDEYRPHAAYPDIFKSVLLLAVADQVLEGGLQFTNDGMSLSPICAWTLHEAKSTEPIKSFGMDLHGHTWTRRTTNP